MPIKILFTCPHAAGKSLAAATYFRSAAFRAELDVEIAVAGPEPDEHNMPAVVDALSTEGFRIDWHPKLITSQDAADADHVISIGCDREALPADVDLVEWDAPLISQDLTGSLRAIHDHCENLADQLTS